MASDKSFTHISVNSGDDDVVIHAGVSPVPQPSAAVEGEWEAETFEEGEWSPEEVGAPECDIAARGVNDGGQEASTAVFADAQDASRASAAKPKDGYRETTLDDIQGSRMGTTQKVVIALAVVLIICILVWQIAFNG